MKNWLNENRAYFCSISFFFIVSIFVFLPVQSMDGQVKTQQAVALKIVLMARPDLFNYKMIRCMSELSMDCSNIFQQTA